jgi:hypothetical protein
MKKNIVLFLMLLSANVLAEEVNGKWFNFNNGVINLDRVSYIKKYCNGEGEGNIYFYSSFSDAASEQFTMSLDNNCKDAYEEILDFLDDDDSYLRL